MSKRTAEPTLPPRERAFLVGIHLRSNPGLLSLEDSLLEISQLSDTAGLEIVGETSQSLDQPHTDTYIGSGKVEEIKALAEDSLTDIIIFDVDLSPRHQRELEEKLGDTLRVLDRTGLILDIFAQHAHTREGSLQVELAQLEYRLPRLTRAWTHLARQAGGGGGRAGGVGGVGLRGPGETQLEVDRREIRRRISILKSELEKVRAHRMRYRAERKRSRVPIVALVGYTNAGKSTLLNALAHTDLYVADQLFATLDPTTRRILLPGNKPALLTDTVGFIQKLPTQLIAAFRATLEEINEADLLLHIVDISHANVMAHFKAVMTTLSDIGADKIPALTILNKMDLLPDPNAAQQTLEKFPDSVAISAFKREGLNELIHSIEKKLYESFIKITVKIPYQQGQLISLFHEVGQVEKVEHGNGTVRLSGLIPGRYQIQFQSYIELKSKK